MAEENIPQDRRCASRVETSHLVVHAEPGERDLNHMAGLSVTLDLNEFGIRIQTTYAFTVGDRYQFMIALKEDVVSAMGKVVYGVPALNGTFEHGVEFVEISARDIEKIRRFLEARV